MLKPVIKALNVSKDARIVTLSDVTGAYNVTTNPGGYGDPNMASPPARTGITARFWSDKFPYANKVIEDSATILAFLQPTGLAVTKQLMGQPAGYFQSGVHQFKYYPFQSIDTVVALTNGSTVLQYISGATPLQFDAAFKAIVIIDGLNQLQTPVLLIDRTQILSATQFSMNIPWSGADGTYAMMIATEADLKVLFTQMAEACIVSKIGYSAERINCDDTEIQRLLGLVRWKLTSEIKYQQRDYDKAHKLITAAEKECMGCTVLQCTTCN